MGMMTCTAMINQENLSIAFLCKFFEFSSPACIVDVFMYVYLCANMYYTFYNCTCNSIILDLFDKLLVIIPHL